MNYGNDQRPGPLQDGNVVFPGIRFFVIKIGQWRDDPISITRITILVRRHPRVEMTPNVAAIEPVSEYNRCFLKIVRLTIIIFYIRCFVMTEITKWVCLHFNVKAFHFTGQSITWCDMRDTFASPLFFLYDTIFRNSNKTAKHDHIVCPLNNLVHRIGWLWWWRRWRLGRPGNEYQKQWASYQIRKIAGCACAGNAKNIFLTSDFKGNR